MPRSVDKRPDRRSEAGMTLIELLAAMAIMTVISTMIIMSWVSLSRSYAYSVKSSKSREYARDAASRMTREIRDAQGIASAWPLVQAGPYSLTFTTAFNRPGASDPLVQPRLVRYSLSSGKLYRTADTLVGGAGNNTLDDETPVPLVGDVVNAVGGSPAPVFRYTYIDSDGTTKTTANPGANLLARIISVEIRLRIDLNPGRSPDYFELVTTAQPRNMRQ
jgi:prepilin-type N-terminal cleavage/methylation domain-containing protein